MRLNKTLSLFMLLLILSAIAVYTSYHSNSNYSSSKSSVRNGSLPGPKNAQRMSASESKQEEEKLGSIKPTPEDTSGTGSTVEVLNKFLNEIDENEKKTTNSEITKQKLKTHEQVKVEQPKLEIHKNDQVTQDDTITVDRQKTEINEPEDTKQESITEQSKKAPIETDDFRSNRTSEVSGLKYFDFPNLVNIQEQEKKSENILLSAQFPEHWFSIGIGASYTFTKEELADYNGGQVSSIDSPHFSIRTGGMITEKKGIDLIYKETPGKLVNESSGSKVTENYKWKILSAELLHLEQKGMKIWGYDDELFYRFGFQNHQFFTIIPVTPNSTNVQTLNTSITNLSAGVQYKFMTRPKVRTEFIMRFQYPISGSTNNLNDTFSVSPIFSFDGSLGYTYKMNETMTIGSYWFGQWQYFKFKYKRSADEYSGSQLFFNSTVDLRIGFEF